MIVTDSLTIDGGSAKVALDSAIALADSGLEVTVFAAAGEASPELSRRKNIRVLCTDQGEALSSSNRLGGAIRGLWNRLAQIRMDALLSTLNRESTVVHIHGWTKALSSSAIASVIRAKFPIVLTLHEYFSTCPTGCLYLHRDRAVCTIPPMSVACVMKNCDSRSYLFKLYRVVRQLVQKRFGRIPSGIRNFITVSAFSRQIISPMLPATSTFYAVDNPVSAVFHPRVGAERNEQLLFIGRLSPEKGGVLLAEAARRARARVLFVGDGAEREEIMRVNPEALFTGWLTREGVEAELRAARCLVVPSMWYETLGLVVLEAAALGIPAIVPRGTAVYDLIEPDITGLSFKRGDVASLTAAIMQLSDDTLVEQMSRAAYAKFWSKPPTMDVHLESLLNTYRAVLDIGTPSPIAVQAS